MSHDSPDERDTEYRGTLDLSRISISAVDLEALNESRKIQRRIVRRFAEDDFLSTKRGEGTNDISLYGQDKKRNNMPRGRGSFRATFSLAGEYVGMVRKV